MMLLVEPLIPALRRYARSLLQDRTAADDLVQDCLERAVRSWHQRRANGDARTWMFTILHNLAVNRMRQNARRGRDVPLADADDAALSRPPSQEEGIRQTELLQALNTLPDDERSVLLLVSVEDLSYAEAAQVLDIPIGTVMSRLSRAREKLLRTLEGTTIAAARGPALRRIK